MDLLFHLQDVLLHVSISYWGVIRTLKGKLKYASLVTQHPVTQHPVTTALAMCFTLFL